MKLRNKKTGEIRELQNIMSVMIDNHIVPSLIAIENEWEGYEEPKDYYYVTTAGSIKYDDTPFYAIHRNRKAIGNYFETREEAEKAVEKLKAWKRLKDKGFKLDGVVDKFFCLDIYISGDTYNNLKDDLKIVFGGEE